MDQLLTKSDAGRILGLTPAAVVQLEKRGELLATRTAGGIRLFSKSDVVKLARRRQSLRLANRGVSVT